MKVDIQAYQRVFEEMGYSNEEGALLLIRTQLLKTLKDEIEKKKWSQAQAAEKLGVKQPRISEIHSLRIDKFSVELLIKYLYRLDKSIEFKIKRRASS